MRPTVFHIFLNLVRVWEDFPIKLRAHPLHMTLFRFTLEEEDGVAKPVHWEAPSEGNLNPEVQQVKELI